MRTIIIFINNLALLTLPFIHTFLQKGEAQKGKSSGLQKKDTYENLQKLLGSSEIIYSQITFSINEIRNTWTGTVTGTLGPTST